MSRKSYPTDVSGEDSSLAGPHRLAVHLTPAEEHERVQVDHLCAAVQHAAGHIVELAWADRS